MEMELGLGSGTTFITAHLFFYSTYNICQKQDTHTHMSKHTHTWAHGHTLSHTLAHMGIYWLFILYSNARHRTPNVSEALAVSLAGRLAEGYPGRGFVPCTVCECVCVCVYFVSIGLSLGANKGTDTEKWREFTWVICATSCTTYIHNHMCVCMCVCMYVLFTNVCNDEKTFLLPSFTIHIRILSIYQVHQLHTGNFLFSSINKQKEMLIK